MSDQTPKSEPATPPAPPRPRRPVAVSVIMVLIGVILLLPGVCAIIFAGAMGGGGANGGIVLLWLISIAISVGGLMLIISAFR